MSETIPGQLSKEDREWIKENVKAGIIENLIGGNHSVTFKSGDEAVLFKLRRDVNK